MGGQACVFYGAAEFSRDIDLLILVDPENMERLRSALEELQADPIAVPPLTAESLAAGHAIHFRCARPDVAGLRIDLMARLRGAQDFQSLFERRTTIEIGGETVDLLGLEDLIAAKKTQRDKDWPMIRRLVEVHYFEHGQTPSEPSIRFWLRELRTSDLLSEVSLRWPEQAGEAAALRPAVAAAIHDDPKRVTELLEDEERRERNLDAEYWKPLKLQLEEFRRSRRRP